MWKNKLKDSIRALWYRRKIRMVSRFITENELSQEGWADSNPAVYSRLFHTHRFVLIVSSYGISLAAINHLGRAQSTMPWELVSEETINNVYSGLMASQVVINAEGVPDGVTIQ